MQTVDLRQRASDIWNIVQDGINRKTILVNRATSFLDLNDTPNSFVGQSGNMLAVAAGEDAIEFVSISSLDERTKVSSNDTTAGYLNGKLVAGTGISFIENNDGGNETLTISSSITQYTDEQVDDRVAALLVAGTNITLTYDDGAGTLTIDATGGGASTLDDLTDAIITTPSIYQHLEYDDGDSAWKNVSDLTMASGAIITSASGEVLTIQPSYALYMYSPNGPITIEAGVEAGAGAAFDMLAGSATSDNNTGGGYTMTAGTGFGSGAGGNLTLHAGYGGDDDGPGGNVDLESGGGGGSGVAGKIRLRAGVTAYAMLDTSNLILSNRTFLFPDADGTFALTDDIVSDHGSLSGLGDDDHTQYHNDSRALTWLGTRSTSDLPEGTNLYFTNERVDDRVASLLTQGTGITLTYDDGANTLTVATTITQYTDEMAQDAVGGMLSDAGDIDFTYTDATPSVTADVKSGAISLAKMASVATGTVFYRKTAGTGDPEVQTLATLKTDLGLTGTNSGDQTSIVGIAGTKAEFDTAVTDGNFLYVGDVTQYTDEMAQDTIGAILTDSATIDFTYNDSTPSITASVIQAALDHGSIGGLADDDHTQYHTDARAKTWLAALSGAAKNKILMHNGTDPVWAADGTTFTFSCTSFSDGEATSQLAGSGTWRGSSTMSFTAAYDNGPPTTATVKMSINGGAYNTVGAMTGPAYTAGTNSSGAISYPTVDQTLRFRLESTDGVDSDTDTETAITFNNYVFYGASTTGSSFSEANVEALSSAITSAFTTSRSINAGASNYVVWAYPSRYASIHATGAIFNGVTMPFTAPETVSITNSAGLTENYKVFASVLTNLGNSTLQLSTSSTTINRLYYGITTDTSGFNEADVEGLANSTISNDNTQTWNSVTAGAGEYLLFAFPTRLGIPTFFVGGFEGGFESPETVAVTNINGYTENYYVWRSTNANLGATIVTTS